MVVEYFLHQTSKYSSLKTPHNEKIHKQGTKFDLKVSLSWNMKCGSFLFSPCSAFKVVFPEVFISFIFHLFKQVYEENRRKKNTEIAE